VSTFKFNALFAQSAVLIWCSLASCPHGWVSTCARLSALSAITFMRRWSPLTRSVALFHQRHRFIGFSDTDCRGQPHCCQRSTWNARDRQCTCTGGPFWKRAGAGCGDLAAVTAARSTLLAPRPIVCHAADRDANSRIATGDALWGAGCLSVHSPSKPDDCDGRSDTADHLSGQSVRGLRAITAARKTRRVESAGFKSVLSRYELRDPRLLKR